MGTLFGITIIIVLVYGIVYYWRQKPAQTLAEPLRPEVAKKRLPARITATVQRSASIANNLRNKLSNQQDTFSTKQFKAWVASAAASDGQALYDSLPRDAQDFAGRTAALSDAELQTLIQQVSDFCTSLNLNLHWLFEAQLDEGSEPKQAVEGVVMLYCLAHAKATRVQDDVKALNAFQNWQAKPEAAEQRDVTQRVYGRLVEKGLVTAPSPDQFMQSDKERQTHVVSTVQQMAKTNKQALLATFKEVVTGDTPSEPTAQKESTQKASHSQVSSADESVADEMPVVMEQPDARAVAV